MSFIQRLLPLNPFWLPPGMLPDTDDAGPSAEDAVSTGEQVFIEQETSNSSDILFVHCFDTLFLSL